MLRNFFSPALPESMRNALHALTDELRRLKSAGVKTVSVSDTSIAALRRVMVARAGETRNQRPVVGETKSETGNRKPETGSPRPETGDRRPEMRTPEPETAKSEVSTRAPEPPPRKTPTAVIPKMEVAALPAAPVVMLPAGDKTQRWAALLAAVMSDGTCSSNVRPGKKVVLGVGSLEAKIMFVGEAPG